MQCREDLWLCLVSETGHGDAIVVATGTTDSVRNGGPEGLHTMTPKLRLSEQAKKELLSCMRKSCLPGM